jgi:hypothetical protein
MPTTYLDPLERAWARTREILFRPFDVEKWIVVGFAAFLAGLAGNWAGLGFGNRWRIELKPDLDRWRFSPYESFADAFLGASWFGAGLWIAFVGLVLLVAAIWVSSRGKFIFLDNLVGDRAAILDPWKAHERIGNSLFRWRLFFGLSVLLVFGLLVTPVFALGRGLGDSDFGRPLSALVALAAGLFAFLAGIAAAYVSLFLENFVVPIMFNRDLTATEAWRVFLPLLRQNAATFLLYGVLILLAYVGAGLCLLALFVITCCIGPLLLSVPYLGSVLLLPLTGLYRLYSLEFLAEFGAEYAVPYAAVVESPEDPA